MLETTNSLQKLSDFTGIKRGDILAVFEKNSVTPVELGTDAKTTLYKLADFQSVFSGLLQLDRPKDQIISIVNRKGGVGKTTVATMLSIGLSTLGYKVLCIDYDSQKNISSTLLPQDYQGNESIASDFLTRKITLDEAKVSILPNLDFIEGTNYSLNLSQAITNNPHNADTIKYLFDDLNIKEKYDYIIIDCAPAEGPFQNAVLKASDLVISPIEIHQYSVNGVLSIKHTVEELSKRDRVKKKMRILVNKYEQANKNHLVAFQSIAEGLGDHLYALPIRKLNGIQNSTNYADLDFTSDATTYSSYKELNIMVTRDTVEDDFLSIANSEIGTDFKEKIDSKVNKIYGESEVSV